MYLKDGDLFRTQAYIDGEWADSSNGTFPVHNPATGEKLADVPGMGAHETRQAIAAAHDAFDQWRSRPARERAAFLRQWADLMREHKDDLAVIMTSEQGKPLTEAKGEIDYAASFLEWFGEEAKRVYGDTIPAPGRSTRTVVIKQPIGVAAGITPWNFPSAMITRKAAPALAAGNTIVLKSAEQTPLSALALCELARRAGIPRGVFNTVTGSAEDAPAIGGEMTSNPTVRKVSFTGSTEVGKLLMKQSADTVKKLSLELGGNAPFIVYDDAGFEAAVKGLLAGKFRNSGQTCVTPNRVFVQNDIYDRFAERFTEEVQQLTVGNGLEGGTQVGPLIDGQGLAKVERLVDDAVSRGAQVRTGGKRHDNGGTYYEPTVLTDVTPEMDLFREEIFGPVAPLYRFEGEEDVLRQANDTRYGLAAYFFGRDVGRVWRTSEGLEFGIIGANTGIISTESAPFGGVKESGMGREGSKYGIDDWVEVKYVSMGGVTG